MLVAVFSGPAAFRSQVVASLGNAGMRVRPETGGRGLDGEAFVTVSTGDIERARSLAQSLQFVLRLHWEEGEGTTAPTDRFAEIERRLAALESR